MLLFTAGVAVATGIVFGLVPALSASSPNLHDALKDGTRGTTVGRGRLRKALVVAEVALSMVLLVGTGLMVRSFMRLRGVDPGFEPEHALTLSVSLPVADGKLTTPTRSASFPSSSDAGARLAQLPGVTHGRPARPLPMSGNTTDQLFELEGFNRRQRR